MCKLFSHSGYIPSWLAALLEKARTMSLVNCFLIGMGHDLSMILSLFQPKQIQISSKTGIPLNVLPKKGLTAKQVERMQMINGSDLPKVSTQPRSKNESKEDKKARKQAIKEERKVMGDVQRACSRGVVVEIFFCKVNLHQFKDLSNANVFLHRNGEWRRKLTN